MGLVNSKGKKSKSSDNIGDEKILEVDASMQGDFHFKDPVNLKINGRFEGTLDTKGSLIVNKDAFVKAKVNGEFIEIAGEVKGDIIATKGLVFKESAKVQGKVITPLISIEKGAFFEGTCSMEKKSEGKQKKSDNEKDVFSEKSLMNINELADYIEVDHDSILQWIKENRIPAKKIEEDWKFDRMEIDQWIAESK